MSKIVIAGDACVVTMEVTLEDLKKAYKGNKDALSVYKGEGKEKEVVYSIEPGCTGSISRYGAVFAGESPDDHKYATITWMLPAALTDAKEYVADRIGCAKRYLDQIEEQVKITVEELNIVHADVLSSIVVA